MIAVVFDISSSVYHELYSQSIFIIINISGIDRSSTQSYLMRKAEEFVTIDLTILITINCIMQYYQRFCTHVFFAVIMPDFPFFFKLMGVTADINAKLFFFLRSASDKFELNYFVKEIAFSLTTWMDKRS